MDIQSDVTKVAADAKAAEADAIAVKSWLAANWHYAVAIAVGALFLGMAVGMKIGAHFHG